MLERTTIQEIAIRAGVSAGTVSRILNGKNKENRPTIAKRSARVRKIATELGYRPNAAARSMLSGRFNLVAFVTCGSIGFDWYPKQVIHGLHDTLAAQNMRLVITELSREEIESELGTPQLLRQSMVDGVVAMPEASVAGKVMGFFRHHRMPCVTINHKQPERSVCPDDFGGATMLTKYVLRQGRKRLGFFQRTARLTGHHSDSDRRRGVDETCRQHGLGEVPVFDLPPGSPKRLARPEDAEAYLVANPRLDAVICYEAPEALAMHVAAGRMGIRVPDDLLVVAFHDRELHAEYGIVAPTAIIPFRRVATEAANMLLRIVDGQDPNPPMMTVPFLQIIDSTTEIPIA